MFQKLKENISRIAAPLVLITSILILIIYSDNSIQEKWLFQAETQLYQLGKAHEYEIKKELEQYSSIADLLVVSFSKDVENKDFGFEAKKLLKTVMSKHKRIRSVSLVLKTQDNNKDELIKIHDDSKIQQISLTQSETGEILDVS